MSESTGAERQSHRLPRAQPKPAGGIVWPLRWSPQQAALPFVLITQVWRPPALTAVKVPARGVACPSSLAPQQAMAPFVVMAQVRPAVAHRDERARGRGRLSAAVAAPAGDGATGPQAAGVSTARAAPR